MTLRHLPAPKRTETHLRTADVVPDHVALECSAACQFYFTPLGLMIDLIC